MISEQQKGQPHDLQEEDTRSPSELRHSIKHLESEISKQTAEMTRMTELNISLTNQLSDTKEMLFEAEKSIQSMN